MTEQAAATWIDFKAVEVGDKIECKVEGANFNQETGSLIVWTDNGMASFYSARYESHTNGYNSLVKALNANLEAEDKIKTKIDFVLAVRSLQDTDTSIVYHKVESTKSKTGYAHRWTVE